MNFFVRDKITATLILAATALLLVSPALRAARIKDIAHVQGTRSEQLIGYGLVVGLNGTGDGRTMFTKQSTASMLNKFGIQVDPDEINAQNVAAVIVTASLRSFDKPGGSLDVTISSVGESSSLQGGVLLRTQLFGYDGKTLYAIAQGPISIGGFNVGAQAGGGGAGAQIQLNHPVVGRIPNGAQVWRSMEIGFINDWRIMLTLENSDFTTARRLDQAIDDHFGSDIALPVDGLSAYVTIPEEYREPGRIIEFISELENLDVTTATSARIVINERTGTIAIGENVTVNPVQIAHGGLTVTIGTGLAVSQPTTPLGGGATVVSPTATASAVQQVRKFIEVGGTAGDLVTALNVMQVTPRDIIAIFQALKEAGALSAKLIIM
ncbi:MAG: flagellar basal body P-ring protein FlgI [Candidatus Glassbacteria bacterium]|nr:flagellar basal body P-ring protein FlgI [Candidatus Glassbacteria bacterium]